MMPAFAKPMAFTMARPYPLNGMAKDILYCELATEMRRAGRPYLSYKHAGKPDMKIAGIDATTLEAATDDSGQSFICA